MKKVIVDTNVLLTGFFVQGSYSSYLIESIDEGSIEGFVSENSLDEASRRLEIAYGHTGFDLRKEFHHRITNGKYNILPPVTQESTLEFKKIKGLEDRAICVHAKKYNLHICTNDISDFKHAHIYDLDVYPPPKTKNGVLNAKYVFPGLLASPSNGTIYMEVKSNWKGYTSRFSDELWTLFDIPSIGSLCFSPASCSLIYFVDNGPDISLSLKKVDKGETWIRIVISYDYQQGVFLYLNNRGQRASVTEKWSPPNVITQPAAKVFNGRKGAFNGIAGLMVFSSFPLPCTETRANNLMGDKSVTSPLDSLSVEDIIWLNYKNETS